MMRGAEDRGQVEAVYAAMDTAALLALFPVLGELSAAAKDHVKIFQRAEDERPDEDAALNEEFNVALATFARRFPNAGAEFDDLAAMVARLRSDLADVSRSAAANSKEALEAGVAYLVNLSQRKQIAQAELERRGVLPRWPGTQDS